MTKTWLTVAAVAAAAFLAYSNALSNGFVYDDRFQVLENIWITDPKYVPDIFSKDSWAFTNSSSNYYRPVMHVLYMLCFYVFGYKAWGFHLANVILHAGMTALVYLLGFELLKRDTASPVQLRVLPLLAALLFAAHPIHTETVTWIAGAPDLLFALFGVLSFYFYTRSPEGHFPGDRYYVAAVSFFFMALFCKEPALVFLPIIFFYDGVFHEKPMSLARRFKRIAPFVVAAGVYLAFRLSAIKGFAPHQYNKLGPLELILNAPVLFLGYLEKLLLPVNLNIYHDYRPAKAFVPEMLPAFAVTAVFLLLWFIARKRDRLAFLGMTFIALPLLPAFYISAISESVFSERYLYLPSLGLMLVIMAALRRVSFDNARNVTAVATLGVLVFGFYSAATINRNRTFANDLALWADAVKKSPDAAQPHDHLGFVYLQKGGLEEEAIKQFELAIKLKPDYDAAFHNLGLAYWKTGRTDEAVKALQKAVELLPEKAEYRNDLGMVLEQSGQLDRAAIEFDKAVRLDPSNLNYQNNLARVLVMPGLKR